MPIKPSLFDKRRAELGKKEPTTIQTITGVLLMLQLTKEELGEIIELTEEIVPLAKKRMEIIARACTRPQAFTEEDVVKEITDAFDRGYAVAMSDITDMGKEN